MSKQVIAVEGLDLAGKSTMMNYLHRRLTEDEVKVLTVAEPMKDTHEQRLIRSMVIDPKVSKVTQAYCAIALRAHLYGNQIIPALADGYTVLSDRCLLTSVVYQSSPSQPPGQVLEMNQDAAKHFKRNFIPDVIVFLEIPHSVYLQRYTDRMNTVGVEEIENELTDPAKYALYQQTYLTVLLYLEQKFGTVVIRSNDGATAYAKLMDYLKK